MSTDWR